MATTTLSLPSRTPLASTGAAVASALVAFVAAVHLAATDTATVVIPRTASKPAPKPQSATARTWAITYRAHSGAVRNAYVLLPSWYGPRNNPPLPLVIAPHGRGVAGKGNAKLWGNLPALGGFAVVSPDGHGRLLGRFSWGSAGQIDDLARMPEVVRAKLPWLRVDRRRVYALGGSMGGQETLLLVARHPRLLAGAVAVDPMVDFARQYANFPLLSRNCNAKCERAWAGPIGERLQWLARREVGGSPTTAPAAYAERSPLAKAREIAFSGVPVHIWWSRTDEVVREPHLQSGALADELRRLNPEADVHEVVGSWVHTAVMRASRELPAMLEALGVLPAERPQ